MRILLTGATGNIGKGLIRRLLDRGHELVLYDVCRLPDEAPFAGLPAVQGDIQAGLGLDRAAAGCDLVVHTPAWHGIHWHAKTEADFWRLNVDGTFWMFQAAVAAGITRVVFLSSEAWHRQYDKYGFTKRVGEELCEYHRRSHGVRYVIVRPNDLTPWDDFLGYGTRLLHGGVDRDDVLDCIVAAVTTLAPPGPPEAGPEGIVVRAARADPFTEADLAGWADDPVAACDRLFPNSGELVEKYGVSLRDRPEVSTLGEAEAGIGYAPVRHFGTFVAELRRLDAAGGPDAVRSFRCPY